MNERRGDGFWLLIFLALLVAAKPAADAATPPPTPHARTYAKPDAPLPSSSAARLSPEAIYAYARRARFTPDQAVTATAIALAESKPSGGGR